MQRTRQDRRRLASSQKPESFDRRAAMIKIKRGLDLPIAGEPRQDIGQGPAIRSVAILGGDYVGMKPTMEVREGDAVKKGQVIFTDKKCEGVKYTAPAAGTIKAVHRGAKRVLLSVEIEVADKEESVSFKQYSADELSGLQAAAVREQLIDSGVWTVLRTRPFGKVPAPDAMPASTFVTAMDTNPLAANPDVIIADQEQAFRDGLVILSKLTEGPVWVCKATQSPLPSFAAGQIGEETLAGPHPAGYASTNIHVLYPGR